METSFCLDKLLYVNSHRMEINKSIASLLSGKEKLPTDDGETSEMLVLFSTSVFIPRIRWKLETCITHRQKGQISAPCANGSDKPEALRSAEHI